MYSESDKRELEKLEEMMANCETVQHVKNRRMEIRRRYTSPVLSLAERFGITDEEKDYIVKYLVVRGRNYISTQPEHIIRGLMWSLWDKPMQEGDKINFPIDFTNMIADVKIALEECRA
jgi:hypothetical protein